LNHTGAQCIACSTARSVVASIAQSKRSRINTKASNLLRQGEGQGVAVWGWVFSKTGYKSSGLIQYGIGSCPTACKWNGSNLLKQQGALPQKPPTKVPTLSSHHSPTSTCLHELLVPRTQHTRSQRRLPARSQQSLPSHG